MIKNCTDDDRRYKITENKDMNKKYVEDRQKEVIKTLNNFNLLIKSINWTEVIKDNGSIKTVNYLDEITEPFIIKDGVDNGHLKDYILSVTNDIQTECLFLVYALENKQHAKTFNTLTLENLIFNDIMLKLEFIDEIIHTRKTSVKDTKQEYMYSYIKNENSFIKSNELIHLYTDYINNISSKIDSTINKLLNKQKKLVDLNIKGTAIPRYVNIFKHRIDLYSIYLDNTIKYDNEYTENYFNAINNREYNKEMLDYKETELDIWYKYVLDIVKIILEETKLIIHNINKANIL